MHLSERETDDGDGEQQCQNKMEGCNLPPAGQDPQDVEAGAQTSGLAGLIGHLTTKRPQAECSDFDYLNSERDAYYSYTIEESYYVVN